ncbi:LLM class flavin-dependent oxidoreductase [Streptomyces violaceusniger]|uniref:LLM class flavin-dependent oxidoreductase n=1 Tax=Streptomyces violaceusniger TaxID=68280 RepID=UPI0034377368
MKIGMVMAIRNHPDYAYPLQEVYRDYIDDAVYVESEMGFDNIWVNEHHLSRDQYAPSVFPILGAIAARTTRARLGTAVCLLPFHNPLRVSEDAATIDIISGGRFDFGVGVGSAAREYETFGTPREQAWKRTWEATELIRRSWEESSFDFDGEFYSYKELSQPTKPVQKHVPIWWGGFGPQSMARAARRGFNLIGCASSVYEETLATTGRAPSDSQIGQVTGIHLAPTRDQAWDEAQHGIHWWMRFHREATGAPAGMTPDGPLMPELPPAEKLRDIEGLTFMPGMPSYVGTPDDVLENLLADCAGRHGRITQLVLAFRHAGMRTAEVRSSMELFRKEVLPNLPR